MTGRPRPRRDARWLRWLLVGAGFLALALGLLGVVLPGLPTTPFVLLSAACFARASPTLHRRLLDHRLLGPMVRDWERHRTLPRRVRWLALATMTVMVSVSAWALRDQPMLSALVIGCGLIGAWVVLRIRVRD